MKSIIWMSEPSAGHLRGLLAGEVELTFVRSVQEFLSLRRDTTTTAFLDSAALEELMREVTSLGADAELFRPPTSVVAVCDGSLQSAVAWLPSRPWLSHVISASMLTHSMGKEHILNVVKTLGKAAQPRLVDWLGASVVGRRVRLAQASKRVERLERMSDFFASQGIGARTIQLLRDVAEEMLTNAFYDAPVAAGAVSEAISRTQDVALAEEFACHIVYGCRDDLALVRVRDPFGALSRDRLVQVLNRCAQSGMQVEVDETMGGAGLGLWRIFSVASFVAVSVVNRRRTEFLVGIRKQAVGPRPFAFHLFFKEHGRPVRRWQLVENEEADQSVNQSITIFSK